MFFYGLIYKYKNFKNNFNIFLHKKYFNVIKHTINLQQLKIIITQIMMTHAQ